MSPASYFAMAVAIGFAFMLGVSDAPNASASLIASRCASYRSSMAFSFAAHVCGGLIAGQAVAATMSSLEHVSNRQLPGTYIAGGLVSLGFTLIATRKAIPVSASIGLVGGLAGAAIASGGWHSVGWGGMHGVRPYGVLGTLLAIGISPIVGGLVAAGLRRFLGRTLRKAGRETLRPVRVAIWITAGLVGLADGSNDGQKAMGLITALLVAAHSIPSFAVPFWTRLVVAVVLALGTASGGRKIIQTVSSRFYRGGPLDGLAAQGAAAVSILGSAWLGAPVSTSTVVASGMIGVGASRRYRHVHWPTVRTVVSAWVITLPVCAVLGAGAVEIFKMIGVFQ